MQITRIDHASFDVTDRARALAWYGDVLGLRANGRASAPDEPVFLGPPGARIALFEGPASRLRHVALTTDAAGQRAVRERLERLGVAYVPERHRASDSIYLRDLDGATLELMVPR